MQLFRSHQSHIALLFQRVWKRVGELVQDFWFLQGFITLNKMNSPNERAFYPKCATTREFDWGLRTKNVNLILLLFLNISNIIFVQNEKNAVNGGQISPKLSREILDMSVFTRNLSDRSQFILLCGTNYYSKTSANYHLCHFKGDEFCFTCIYQ